MTMQQASEEELLKQQASEWGQAWEDKPTEAAGEERRQGQAREVQPGCRVWLDGEERRSGLWDEGACIDWC